MKPVSICFWIDVSGMPYSTIYVGVIASTNILISKAAKELKKEAPRLFSKKARQLNREEILKVLKILDKNKVRMFTTCFTSGRWEMYRKEFGLRKDFKSKMLGYIYYKLISRQHLLTNFSYQVITCRESHLQIEPAHLACKKLAESDKVNLSFSIATAIENEGVRLADYVAQSLKSNRIEKLKEVKSLICFSIERDERLLKKLFD